MRTVKVSVHYADDTFFWKTFEGWDNAVIGIAALQDQSKEGLNPAIMSIIAVEN